MIHVVEEEIQRGDALDQACLHMLPLRTRNDARHQVEGKDSLSALVVAIDGERDPLLQESSIGGLLPTTKVLSSD